MAKTATIKYDGVEYYCSNCRMRFHKLHPVCPFCESICTNYESVVMELLHDLDIEEVKKVLEC